MLHLIKNETLVTLGTTPDPLPGDALPVRSRDDLLAAPLSLATLTALYRARPEARPDRRFKTRAQAAEALWDLLQPEPETATLASDGGPAEVAAPPIKQALLISLLRREGGATLEELAAATGWQKHSVRGALAGALKRRLGLTILSERTDAGRTYRIADTGAGDA